MAKKHVILFAGTTEGRILANWLDEQSGVTGIVRSITVAVCFVYGNWVTEIPNDNYCIFHLRYEKMCVNKRDTRPVIIQAMEIVRRNEV